MEFSPSSRRVAPGGAWAATAFSSLALGGTQFVSRSSRTPVSKDAHRPGQGAQPPGRPGCVGHRGFQSERGAASRIATCQRACCQAGSEREIVSEAAKTAARLKVDRLEKAVEALGDYDGPGAGRVEASSEEGQGIGPGIAHRRPDHAVQGVHRAQRETPCKMEAERIAEKKLLEEGRARLSRLEQAFSVPVGNVADATVVAPDTEVELARLRAPSGRAPGKCRHRETSRQTESGRWRSLAPYADVGARRIVRVDGRPSSRVARSDECRRQCAGVDRDIEVVRSRPTHVRVDWVYVVSFTRSCDARYGMRGVRVGEASNPGPVQTRQSRARSSDRGPSCCASGRRPTTAHSTGQFVNIHQKQASPSAFATIAWSWDSDSELDGPVSASRGRGEVEDPDDEAQATEPAVSIQLG